MACVNLSTRVFHSTRRTLVYLYRIIRDFPTSGTPINIGSREVREVNDCAVTRRNNTQRGLEHEKRAALCLLLIPYIYLSCSSEPSQPLHWVSFGTGDDQRCLVNWVRGDAEYTTCQHRNVFSTRPSASYPSMYLLAIVTEQQVMVVRFTIVLDRVLITLPKLISK